MRNRRPPFPRFRDLSGRELHCDLHLHTHRTDGEAGVDEVLRGASERGLERIAFTEHVRRGSSWFGDFAREVRDKARAFPDIEVLVGCEAKALDASGTLDASEAILAECDIVLGSVHRIPDGGGFLDTSSFTPEEFARKEWEYAMGLARSGAVDVLAHPGGMYARRHHRDLPDELLREIVAAGIEGGVALEINASYVQDMDRLLGLYRELNPRVSIGSDMHRLDHLGRCRDLLVASGRLVEAPGGREAANR